MKLSPCRIRNGKTCKTRRVVVNLRRDGKPRPFAVHALVLEAFVGPRPEGMECRHLDGDPTNNALANLAWGTRAENIADKRRHGTIGCHHRRKLTAAQVQAIRKEAKKRSRPYREIAADYGVSISAIGNIINGATYPEVK